MKTSIISVLLIFCISLCAFAASVTIIPDNIRIGINDSYALNCIIKPRHNNFYLYWRSEDPYVATVDGNGAVHGINAGYTEIYAELDRRSAKGICKVNVYENPNLSLNKYRTSLTWGKTETLIAYSTYKTDYYFSTSDSRICEVRNNGTLIGHLPGNCIITVSTSRGDTVHCYVHVHEYIKYRF